MKVFARLASMRAPFIALALIAATSVSGCSGNNTKSAENFNPDVSQGPGVNQSPEHHSDPSTEAPDKRGHQKEPEPDLPGCELAHEWQTVDYFRIESPRLDATAASIASTSYAVLVAGQADIDPYVSRWTVRRSLDRGDSWHTVDVYPSADDVDAEAVGVAVDRWTDIVYALGQIRVSNDIRHWIVRKSYDHGKTWHTVDDFSTGRTDLRASAIAVDDWGRVYVVGTSGKNKWTVRRSASGGYGWRTVDEFKPDVGALPTAIAITPDGGVFVGGMSYENGTGIWLVRHSRNGLSSWQVVDRHELTAGKGASVEGATADRAGNIVFVGRAYDSAGRTHWIARTANRALPKQWVTIDDFFVEDETSNAIAYGVTFSADGQLFVTGGKTSNIATSDGIFHHSYFTRRGSLDAFSFLNSDEILSTVPSDGLAAGVGADGDIFTAGNVSSGGDTFWLVRKLRCE